MINFFIQSDLEMGIASCHVISGPPKNQDWPSGRVHMLHMLHPLRIHPMKIIPVCTSHGFRQWFSENPWGFLTCHVKNPQLGLRLVMVHECHIGPKHQQHQRQGKAAKCVVAAKSHDFEAPIKPQIGLSPSVPQKNGKKLWENLYIYVSP